MNREALGMHAVVAPMCLLGVILELWAAHTQRRPSLARFDPPSVISSVEAAYPLHSVAWGTVVLEITLDDAGVITDVRVVHGIPSLTEPAERSVREWKFRPARFEGQPIPSKVAVAFSFVPPNVGPRL
jgi:TonB family protein